MLIKPALSPSRSRFFSRSAMYALLGLASGLGPVKAQAFTLEEIGEWVVSCDNAGTCSLVNASQLTQLRVAQPSPFGMSRICINRKAGAASAPQVFVTLRMLKPRNEAQQHEDRMLRVAGGGRQIPDIPMLYRGNEHWEVPAALTNTLLTELEQNVQLHVVARDGTVLERLSVQGIDRALSVIDHAQKRAGTATALRDLGTRSASAVPAGNRARALVTAPLRALTSPPTPSPAALKLRREACGVPGLDATRGYRLLGDQNRPDRTLWVTPCDSQQGLRRAYFVIEHPDGAAVPVAFPGTMPARPTGQDGLLAIPEFDAQTGRVRELWREPVPPGPGKPCIIQRLWGWTGQAFELAEERRSLSCAGFVSGHWPRTFTREIIMPAAEGAPAVASSFNPPC